MPEASGIHIPTQKRPSYQTCQTITSQTSRQYQHHSNPNDIDEDDESVEHHQTIRQLRNYIAMETKLKAQIIAAIDSEFLAPQTWIWTHHQQTDATTPNQQILNHHREHQGTQCPMEH